MKKLSTMAALAAICSLNVMAADHSINAVGRAGWFYKDNDVKKTATPNSSAFSFDFLRTSFAGNLTPSVKYLLTSNLLGDKTTDSVDGLSAFIDEAYVTKSFSNGPSLTFGKKIVLIGGREYDYFNFDRYSVSSFYAATPANQVGLTLSHEIAGQTFTAQYFNGNKNNGRGASVNSQSKFGYSLGMSGSLLDGMIKPMIAYSVVPKTKGDSVSDSSTSLIGSSSATRSNSGDDAYLAAGVQVNLNSAITFELDYDLLTQKDADLVGAAKKDSKLNSMVALVRYNSELYSPFAKLISETRKTDSTKTAQRMAYDLGVEFKESKDDAIRYHVVYSGSTVKTSMDSTELKSSPSMIMVGLKFDASILK